MIIFNLVGIAVLAVGFGIAFGVGKLLGIDGEGPLMMIAGPLVAALDLGYRLKSEHGHWLTPSGGGSLFFVPAWCLGILWLILGAVRTFSG